MNVTENSSLSIDDSAEASLKEGLSDIRCSIKCSEGENDECLRLRQFIDNSGQFRLTFDKFVRGRAVLWPRSGIPVKIQ